MHHIFAKSNLLKAAIGVFMVFVCANSFGQNSPDEIDRKPRVSQLVLDLASRDFRTRRSATEALKAAGDEAIGPLQEALKQASLDQRTLIESILQTLKQNSFTGRIAAAKKSPAVAVVADLPEWVRFAKLVGTTSADIQLYLELLEAEPQLFSAAMKQSRNLPDLLEARAASLLRTTRPAPAQIEQFSVKSYVALLLLAGNSEYRLPRATSSNVSRMLSYPTFRESVKQSKNAWQLRIAGSYIQRDRIAVIAPLLFAHEHKMPEGLPVARNVLTNALRGRNGLYAMMVIRDMGTKEDIALLESIFNNRGVMFQGPLAQNTNRYTVYNGDLALAVAVAMRGKDPRDFGYRTPDPATAPFRFSLETVGFNNDATRQSSREKYAAGFILNEE